MGLHKAGIIAKGSLQTVSRFKLSMFKMRLAFRKWRQTLIAENQPKLGMIVILEESLQTIVEKNPS